MRGTELAAFGLRRFGLGARPGDLDRASPDPRAYLRQELDRAAEQHLLSGLPGSAAALVELKQYNRQLQAHRMAKSDANRDGSGPPAMTSPRHENAAMAALPEKPVRRLYLAEAEIRMTVATEASSGFRERLAWFWANHFAVSNAKGGLVAVASGPFEREAIRPFVTGKFADMLIAVETHPAMLVFLDNQSSIGPNSPAGRNRRRGLNENLAREILELHTLGVSGGYTQADVTSLARIITGWTVAHAGKSSERGRFKFNPDWHEPGDHALLGQTFKESGQAQGLEALRMLARHPATARHIAFKMARHFVSDSPPASLVQKLTKGFLDSDGDLKVLAAALLDEQESWSRDALKLRTPMEFMLASMRAVYGNAITVGQFLNSLKALGQPLWTPSGPDGFSDSSEQWASPEGVKTRLDVAVRFASRLPDLDPMTVLEGALDGLASDETRRTVRRAASRDQALALVLMSPEFQRR